MLINITKTLSTFLIILSIAEARNTSNTFGCTQKNQGELGTCHAFAFSCPIENYETLKTFGEKRYEVSTNWLVFVSMIDRLCPQNNMEVNPIDGWYTINNYTRIQQMGYCENKEYHPYVPIMDPWIGMQKQIRGMPKLKATSSIQALWLSLDVNIGNVHPDLENIFKSQFGISSTDAKELYCSQGGEKDKIEKLNQQGKISPEFFKCANQALDKAKAFKNDCSATEIPTQQTSQLSENIHKELKSGNHVIASVRSSQIWPNMHGGHAVDLVNTVSYPNNTYGFSIYNSWGGNGNTIIAPEKTSAIYQAFSLSCGEIYKRDVKPEFLPPSMRYEHNLESHGPSEAERDLSYKETFPLHEGPRPKKHNPLWDIKNE